MVIYKSPKALGILWNRRSGKTVKKKTKYQGYFCKKVSPSSIKSYPHEVLPEGLPKCEPNEDDANEHNKLDREIPQSLNSTERIINNRGKLRTGDAALPREKSTLSTTKWSVL